MHKQIKPLRILAISSLVFMALSAVAQDAEEGPPQKYVEITIGGPLAEVKPAFAFPPRVKTLRSVTELIDRARTDESVSGMLLKIQGLGVGWAALQELRDKIVQFRESGKTVVSYLAGGGNVEYLLACAADRIVLMPAGTIGLTGLRAEVIFYKGLLDKLDIKVDMIAAGKYKSAVEPYTRESMSESAREALAAVLDDLYEQQVEMIADGREELDAMMVVDLINQGPFMAEEAHDANLVDAIQYYDELLDSITENEDEPAEIVSDYGKRSRKAPDLTSFAGFMKLFSMLTTPNRSSGQTGKPRVALIYAAGPIMSNAPQLDPFSSGQVITPARIAKAVRDARKDESMRAVVMRVNSPGGSALASDLIWREVMLTQREKPVVISMGDVAASGGYYIAMAAGTVIAEPGTITGSIGVLGGKLNLQGLYNKVGLTKEVITRGRNANLYSDYGDFTPTERERVEKMIETTYQTFVSKAAAGRRKTEAEIHEIAQGRIWTGRQAKAIGLVDELGGLDAALAAAKKRIALSPDDKIDIVVFPKHKTFFESLMEDMDTEVRIPLTPELALPTSIAKALPNLYLLRVFSGEPVAAVLPFDLRIR